RCHHEPADGRARTERSRDDDLPEIGTERLGAWSVPQGAAIMERKNASDQHGLIDRRAFLDGAGRFVASGLIAGSIFDTMRPSLAWGQQVATEAHPASARLVARLRTRFSFQISVDVNTLDQGLAVATAAVAGGVDIIEMGTPLIKS